MIQSCISKAQFNLYYHIHTYLNTHNLISLSSFNIFGTGVWLPGRLGSATWRPGGINSLESDLQQQQKVVHTKRAPIARGAQNSSLSLHNPQINLSLSPTSSAHTAAIPEVGHFSSSAAGFHGTSLCASFFFITRLVFITLSVYM
jgi:hypothetical protein